MIFLGNMNFDMKSIGILPIYIKSWKLKLHPMITLKLP